MTWASLTTNATPLVVGLAMGFAVIPSIYSIAEDAVFSVPRSLTLGSLALGATAWQTLTRVVILTASPGIFSALMIGLGRAVGETMIVLMATGNTPIMDMNLFEGLRTLAANVAVEMPESEVGGSHYRVLFLLGAGPVAVHLCHEHCSRAYPPAPAQTVLVIMKPVRQSTFVRWCRTGAPGIWLSAGAVSIAVIMTLGLLAVIAVRGLGHFWPAELVQSVYTVPGHPGQPLIGERVQQEQVPRERLKSAGLPVEAGPEFMTRQLFKVGNRDLNGSDFVWVVGEWLQQVTSPPELLTLERREWGNFYGRLVNLKEDGRIIAQDDAAWPLVQARIAQVNDLADSLAQLQKKRPWQYQCRPRARTPARPQVGAGGSAGCRGAS